MVELSQRDLEITLPQVFSHVDCLVGMQQGVLVGQSSVNDRPITRILMFPSIGSCGSSNLWSYGGERIAGLWDFSGCRGDEHVNWNVVPSRLLMRTVSPARAERRAAGNSLNNLRCVIIVINNVTVIFNY